MIIVYATMKTPRYYGDAPREQETISWEFGKGEIDEVREFAQGLKEMNPTLTITIKYRAERAMK